MTMTYRSAGPWGAGKGANLTAAEVDGNFWDHEGRINGLETSPTPPNGISNITVTGSQMFIYLDDATVLGPLTLPRLPFRPTVSQIVSGATHAPVAADANGYVICTNAGGCVVTIPADAEVNIPIDTEISYRQAAAGVISFDAATGVTISGIAGYADETAYQGAIVTIKKVGADSWDLFGLLAVSP